MRMRRFLLIVTILLISGCHVAQKRIPITEKKPTPKPSNPVQPKSYIKEAKLIGVGDIMMHRTQIQSGYDGQSKTYNFDGFFTEVKKILSTGDWAIGNLETTLAGEDAGGYTGYPLFNAPTELADAIQGAGFNILTTANNHALDRGEKGVIRTIKNLRDRQLASTGTATSTSEANKILLVEKNHILMAILAYSYGTNGIPIPQGKNYLVSLINREKIVKDIAKAREKGADIVTVCLHFGEEYQRQPNAEQKKLVDTLVKAGADIILGSHPHVVQPYQVFELKRENGRRKKAVVIYSMGNFISGQVGSYKDFGVIFTVNFRKKFPEKIVEIGKVEAIPTWVHRYSANGKLNYRVLPLAAVVRSKSDRLLAKEQYPILVKNLQDMNRHLESLSDRKSVKLVK
ncbi:capsular biosynthesis protein [Oscillatoriales cyanobacterium USR001]|nr:capsular biosynthesis protein [Oscillatoriales cyanobacterium USR001]